jgi:hypothetical protein
LKFGSTAKSTLPGSVRPLPVASWSTRVPLRDSFVKLRPDDAWLISDAVPRPACVATGRPFLKWGWTSTPPYVRTAQVEFGSGATFLRCSLPAEACSQAHAWSCPCMFRPAPIAKFLLDHDPGQYIRDTKVAVDCWRNKDTLETRAFTGMRFDWRRLGNQPRASERPTTIQRIRRRFHVYVFRAGKSRCEG